MEPRDISLSGVLTTLHSTYWEERSSSKRMFIGAMTFPAPVDSGDSYLIVDYDRNNFSVSQALFPDTNVPQELVAILPPSEHGSSHAMGAGAIAGIAVGAAASVIFLLGIAFLIRRRWLARALKDSNEHPQPGIAKTELNSNEHHQSGIAKTELGSNEHHQPGIAKTELDSIAVDNSEKCSNPRLGLVEAPCNETIIPEFHATKTIQHEAMGDERPVAELPGQITVAELP
jgi:hypothetical protein